MVFVTFAGTIFFICGAPAGENRARHPPRIHPVRERCQVTALTFVCKRSGYLRDCVAQTPTHGAPNGPKNHQTHPRYVWNGAMRSASRFECATSGATAMSLCAETRFRSRLRASCGLGVTYICLFRPGASGQREAIARLGSRPMPRKRPTPQDRWRAPAAVRGRRAAAEPSRRAVRRPVARFHPLRCRPPFGLAWALSGVPAQAGTYAVHRARQRSLKGAPRRPFSHDWIAASARQARADGRLGLQMRKPAA